MAEKKEDKNGAITIPPALSPDIRKAGILRKLKSKLSFLKPLETDSNKVINTSDCILLRISAFWNIIPFISGSTMKKKYFVLRKESETGPARLEYYDNEKKFKAGNPAKRSITIKTCFNINRKVDAKHKYAITLYTKDDSFSVVADSEESVEDWLNAMLELQLDGPCLTGGAKLKPKFEHVWQVTIGDKSLASSRNMKGLYRVCLTPNSLTLVKADQSDPPETLEFPLVGIRRCGHTNNYFVIELGRSSITGAGELWLETEDGVIAQNMHETTIAAMKKREGEDFAAFSRPRSMSNGESSKPITSTRARPIAVVSPHSHSGIRDRCDSLPSRPRTISEGQEVNRYYAQQNYMDSLRPNGGFNRTVSYSPPTLTNPLSPVSCSTDSAGSNLSIDEYDGCQQTDFAHGRYSHNLPTDGAFHTEPPIKEEQLDDYVPMTMGNNSNSNSHNTEGYISMAPVMSSSAPAHPSSFLHLNSLDSAHTSSLPPISQCNDYIEMKSPVDGYINMSPIGANLDVQSSSSLDSSVNDSSQTKDGYIHMAPVHDHGALPQHEGYLDMAPLSSSLPKTFSVSANHAISISSRKDSSSRLSDTAVSSPSSTNLEDFPLDKVKSFLADSDDVNFDSYIRPVRAYSMGSRPQPKKSHLSLQVDGSRIRAYSVGSQASTQRKISNPIDKEMGNLMTMDPRTGAKSSSAPLLNNRPPRIRSSASRSEVGEDLMEIDYNKSKYPTGVDFSHSFTIEPVGRARSGSYSSSSNNALKLLHNRDRMKSQSTGHSSNSVKDDVDSATDYLSMSPISDQGKFSKIGNSTPRSDSVAKKIELLHPPGDYVSLDPSCTYTVGDKYNVGASTNNRERTNTYSASQDTKNNYLVTAPLSKINNCDSTAKSVVSSEESINGKAAKFFNGKVAEPINGKVESSKTLEKQSSSDYMCMNYGQNSNNKDSSAKVQPSPNSHFLQAVSSSEKKEYEPPTTMKNNVSEQKESKPVSPVSRTAPFTPAANFVPKTPPPSPSCGPLSPLSGLPLADTVALHFALPSNGIASAPNCGEIRLNYASLDLPPASEEDGKGTSTKLKKSAEDEVNDIALTYAQIDFSPMKQKAFQETESLSHL